MKRITSLAGATAIAISASGCAVVPAYDVYGPPVAGGIGPGGPVMVGPAPIVVQPEVVLIRQAPAVVRPAAVVVRPAPGRDGHGHGYGYGYGYQGSDAYRARPSSGPSSGPSFGPSRGSPAGPQRGAAYAQSPRGPDRGPARDQSARRSESRSDPVGPTQRAMGQGTSTRKDGVGFVAANPNSAGRGNPDSGKDSGW